LRQEPQRTLDDTAAKLPPV